MQKGNINSSTMELLKALQLIFENEVATNATLAAPLKRVLSFLPAIKLAAETQPAQKQSVCRHLNHALELGEAGPAAAVAEAIRELQSSLIWLQSSNHSLETRGQEFMDNYAYSSLSLTGSSILDVGLLLLGPGITYPVTSYPSEGIFLVIGGAPEWKSEDTPWRLVKAGDIIHRPHNSAEGKRPGNEPLLALYAWMYD